MKILITGNYDPSYNRTKILLKGLKSLTDVTIIEYPLTHPKKIDKKRIKELSKKADFIYLPPFTHESVKPIRKITEKPIIFDPLISKYLTKVFDYKQVSKYSPRAYKNFLKDKIPLHLSNLILADTEAHKNYFIEKFKVDPNKIKVLPIGADTSEFTASNKSESPIFNIGFYGGFIPLQGTKYIIETAKILQKEKDIQFNLVGTGFEWEKMKQLAKKFNLKNILFHGWMDYDKLPNKINEFDICLGIFGDTTKTDLVIPNKIYHYAALKKCIITKDTPAIREIFTPNKNIILIDNKPELIAEQILHLKNNSSYKKDIANAGFQLISTEFNASCIASKFVAILNEYSK